MTKLLNERFPNRLITVDPAKLMNDGLLARPVVYSLSTGQNVKLDPTELAQLARTDVPASVLAKLDQQSRNEVIVSAWQQRPAEWGKTLVFACSIAHADHLAERFTQAGVQTSVLHSQSDIDRGAVLQQFRKPGGPLVLISVGMLLEGVDIPEARTAFLTRPTVSRVLMRQMIGRVLRGPRAGGDTEANVVALQDHWVDSVDILSPIDLRDVDRPIIKAAGPDGDRVLPPVRDEITDEPIAENLLRRIQRAYAELNGRPILSITTAALSGYYMLSDVNVPVFAHTCDTWDELISTQLSGHALPVKSPISLFGDLQVPRPTRQDVDAVLEYIRSTGAEPPFIELKLTFSTRSIARRLLALPAMTEQAKLSWQRDQYEATLARSVYPSFHAFTEALHQEVLGLSDQVTGGTDPESPEAPPVTDNLQKIRRSVKRDIKPLFAQTAKAGRDLLDAAGEDEYRQLLNHLPDVQWTRRPVQSTYAVWVPRISGQSKGTPVIRVNRSLQAPTTQVAADVLRYLLWHELCHHVLPGRGHDAEFHRLLVMWPDFARLDHELDKLSERYDFGWDKAVTR